MDKISNFAFKKVLSIFLAVAALLCIMVLTACESEPLVIKDSETCIVIRTTKDALADNTKILLIDFMADLKEKGELDYTLKNGMIASINGIENPADFSKCWMLYTSDADNANSMWGTVEYQGKEYGSAILGANELKLKADQYYIWVFKPFN